MTFRNGAASLLLLPFISSGQQSSIAVENGEVKALVVAVEPHAKTRLHEHKVNRVMIYLQPGRQTIDYQDGRHTVLNWKAGEAKWSPASGMHIAEITTDNPVTIVELELKNPGTTATPFHTELDPLKVDPKHYKLEFENAQVRVLRVKIGPHESTPLHRHAVDRVVTYLTDQDFRVIPETGTPEVTRHKAGEVSWGTPVTHREENLSSQPIEVLVTEFKVTEFKR
ncbi:MAG: hypothetical protein M3Z09_15685 [Acidobacteriota bacterium]|nr:hypothetical protein [Acidobacteriota bacterium]